MRNENSADEPTFWMNVTTSLNWHRSPVGIVRVEQEIRRHLSDLLQHRLQPIAFKEGKFLSEAAVASRLALDSGDFWPEPSYGSSTELFDPVPAPSAKNPTGAMRPPRKPKFCYGDVLVTMGLDWEYPGLHDEIRRVAQAYNLTVITCCYDLIPVLFPQYCVSDVASWFKNYFIDMTWSADGVLCISENTRRDYLDLVGKLGLPIRRTDVIKLGSSLPPHDDLAPVSKEVDQVLGGRFFLFVSTIERRKNHEVLYRAYHLIRKENPEILLPKLVFVGMEGWGVSELMSDIRLDPLTKGDIVVLPHVTDSELSLLYGQCEAFLYPSHYEGWGLPIAEALELGRPVIASNQGSIPEVGGDLVHYLDPWSPQQWADALLGLANGKMDLKSWSEKIAAEFKPYDWSSAAETVIAMALDLRRDKPSTQVFEAGYRLSTMNGIHYGDKIIYEGREGIVCHGPYIDLAEGSYDATIQFNWVSGDTGSLHFAARHVDGTSLIAVEKRDVRTLKPGEHSITLALDLSEDAERLEFLCEAHCPEKIRFSVDEIVVTRIGSNPARRKTSNSPRIRAA